MYPNGVDKFTDKLNKNPVGNYVVEERLPIDGGKYEGLLAHDNINNQTIRVYTGPTLTGDEITNWSMSVPAATPWRRLIKIFTVEVAEVFVTYETPGDTVEADDINVLQAALTATQTELERYKAKGSIDCGTLP